MKNKYIKDELKREVDLLTPESMVDEIKSKNVVPIIASCVASIILCLAVFLPIALKSKDEYRTWLANKRAQETQIEEEYQNNNK